MQQILAALGAGTSDVVAAFLGSIAGAFMLTAPTARAILSTVVVGTLVGIYFGPNAPPLIGMKPNSMITFIIGASGTSILLIAVNAARRKFSKQVD